MIAEKENFANACGCGGYAGFDGTQDVETGISEYLDFDGTDVESGDFDEFIGKKAKERRAIVKDLKSQGVSAKDARKQAKEKVGGTSLKDVIANVKGKVEGIREKLDSTGGDTTTRSTIEDRSTATDGGTATDGAGAGSGSESPAWQKYAIWGGVALLVAGIGFVAYKKFANK